MPRVKLKPLPHYPFTTEIEVRTTDLNYGGHLGNDRLLALIHEARVAFLSHYGLSEFNFGGPGLLMADAMIVYQAEGRAGDRLRIAVAVTELGRSNFRICYQITRLPEEKPIALVETGMVCFDYKKEKIVPIPEKIKSMFLIPD